MTLEWVKKKYESLDAEEGLKVPGEDEALEQVRCHEAEWRRITKDINLWELDWTRDKLKEVVHEYNQTQRLKPYGRQFYLSHNGFVEESETVPLIEESRESLYKIPLSAKGLPTKDIDDLTLIEAREYYEAIKKEIEELKEAIKKKKRLGASVEVWEDMEYRAKERCALALRVIGELSGGAIPKDLLREYQGMLWG